MAGAVGWFVSLSERVGDAGVSPQVRGKTQARLGAHSRLRLCLAAAPPSRLEGVQRGPCQSSRVIGARRGVREGRWVEPMVSGEKQGGRLGARENDGTPPLGCYTRESERSREHEGARGQNEEGRPRGCLATYWRWQALGGHTEARTTGR